MCDHVQVTCEESRWTRNADGEYICDWECPTVLQRVKDTIDFLTKASDSHSLLWLVASHDRPHGCRCRVLEIRFLVGVPMKKNRPVVGNEVCH